MRRNKPLCEDKSNIGYLSCRNCYCRQYLPTLKKLYEQLNGILNTHTHTNPLYIIDIGIGYDFKETQVLILVMYSK